MPSAVEPRLLYRHLITQCKRLDATALELEVGREEGSSSSHKDEEVGLLIDVNKAQSPDLSALAHSIEVCGCKLE